MGFHPAACERALQLTNGSLDRAIDWLLSNLDAGSLSMPASSGGEGGRGVGGGGGVGRKGPNDRTKVDYFASCFSDPLLFAQPGGASTVSPKSQSARLRAASGAKDDGDRSPVSLDLLSLLSGFGQLEMREKEEKEEEDSKWENLVAFLDYAYDVTDTKARMRSESLGWKSKSVSEKIRYLAESKSPLLGNDPLPVERGFVRAHKYPVFLAAEAMATMTDEQRAIMLNFQNCSTNYMLKRSQEKHNEWELEFRNCAKKGMAMSQAAVQHVKCQMHSLIQFYQTELSKPGTDKLQMDGWLKEALKPFTLNPTGAHERSKPGRDFGKQIEAALEDFPNRRLHREVMSLFDAAKQEALVKEPEPRKMPKEHKKDKAENVSVGFGGFGAQHPSTLHHPATSGLRSLGFGLRGWSCDPKDALDSIALERLDSVKQLGSSLTDYQRGSMLQEITRENATRAQSRGQPGTNIYQPRFPDHTHSDDRFFDGSDEDDGRHSAPSHANRQNRSSRADHERQMSEVLRVQQEAQREADRRVRDQRRAEYDDWDGGSPSHYAPPRDAGGDSPSSHNSLASSHGGGNHGRDYCKDGTPNMTRSSNIAAADALGMSRHEYKHSYR